MLFSSPTREDWASRLLWLLWRLALIGFGLYLLWQLQHVVILLFVSGAVAYLLLPLVDLLSRWRPPGVSPLFWRGIVSMLVLIGFLVLVGWGVRAFLSPFINETRAFVNNSDAYQQKAGQVFEDVNRDYERWYQGLPSAGKDIVDRLQSSLEEGVNGIVSGMQSGLQSMIKQTGVWLNFLVELFLLPVIVFYFLLDSNHLKRDALGMIPRRFWRLAVKCINETNRVMKSYIIGQLILCVIAGIAVWIGLRVYGINYAFTLALFAGVTRAIPVIGSLVAALPIILMSLIIKDATVAIQITVFLTALFLVEHKMIMPKIIGDRVDLHPVLVIVVLLVSGKFFGLVGMFFGVPIAVIVRNVMRSVQRDRNRPHMSQLVIKPAAADQAAAGQGGSV